MVAVAAVGAALGEAGKEATRAEVARLVGAARLVAAEVAHLVMEPDTMLRSKRRKIHTHSLYRRNCLHVGLVGCKG